MDQESEGVAEAVGTGADESKQAENTVKLQRKHKAWDLAREVEAVGIARYTHLRSCQKKETAKETQEAKGQRSEEDFQTGGNEAEREHTGEKKDLHPKTQVRHQSNQTTGALTTNTHCAHLRSYRRGAVVKEPQRAVDRESEGVADAGGSGAEESKQVVNTVKLQRSRDLHQEAEDTAETLPGDGELHRISENGNLGKEGEGPKSKGGSAASEGEGGSPEGGGVVNVGGGPVSDVEPRCRPRVQSRYPTQNDLTKNL